MNPLCTQELLQELIKFRRLQNPSETIEFSVNSKTIQLRQSLGESSEVDWKNLTDFMKTAIGTQIETDIDGSVFVCPVTLASALALSTAGVSDEMIQEYLKDAKKTQKSASTR